jgi:hypothetical protein
MVGTWCRAAGRSLKGTFINRHKSTAYRPHVGAQVIYGTMLLPLLGFVFGVGVSSILGAAVMTIHPRWKLTLTNIVWFVAGSFAAVLGSANVYTWIFADKNRQLQSPAAIVGFLVLLFVATLLGGTLSVFLGKRFFRRSGEEG